MTPVAGLNPFGSKRMRGESRSLRPFIPFQINGAICFAPVVASQIFQLHAHDTRKQSNNDPIPSKPITVDALLSLSISDHHVVEFSHTQRLSQARKIAISVVPIEGILQVDPSYHGQHHRNRSHYACLDSPSHRCFHVEQQRGILH